MKIIYIIILWVLEISYSSNSVFTEEDNQIDNYIELEVVWFLRLFNSIFNIVVFFILCIQVIYLLTNKVKIMIRLVNKLLK